MCHEEHNESATKNTKVTRYFQTNFLTHPLDQPLGVPFVADAAAQVFVLAGLECRPQLVVGRP